ncbi:MAG: hypothetical protein GY780_06505 [bacterium]|nr:hypothetical protein [bacterium]
MFPKPLMKPGFAICLAKNENQVLVRLDRILKSEKYPIEGRVLKKHAFIQLPEEDRTFLSPYLNLSLKEEEDNLILEGRFSPHPHVWTAFMAIYGVLGLMGLGGIVYGWAQSMIGEPAGMMWAGPISLLAIAFVYGAAVIGQGLTAQEMYSLRNVVDRAVENGAKDTKKETAA